MKRYWKKYKKVHIKAFINSFSILPQNPMLPLKYPGRFFKCLLGIDETTIPQRIKKDCEIFNNISDSFEFPLFDKPLVSIVIPVYNNYDYTLKCLYSILQNTQNIPYEVIIADDCSNDETTFIKDKIKNITVIKTSQNCGFLKNCNNAIKAAKGEYIHLLNNDTQVQQNWLSSLLQVFERKKDAGIVGSKLIYPNGVLQEAGGIIWNDATGCNYGKNECPNDPEYNYLKEVDYCSGASILFKKSLWDEIGGFDERFSPAYYEDADFAFETRKKGYMVYYQPLSEIIHFESISHSNTHDELMIKNRQLFIEKHKDTLLYEQFSSKEGSFNARDKSKNKKTLVVIDYQVPTFDKSAGDRATFQYLQLFLELGFNIKFVPLNFSIIEPYSTILQQMGIEVLHGVWHKHSMNIWFKNNASHIDYVYMSRPESKAYIDIIKKYTKAKIIYHVCDLHYLREYRSFLISKNKKDLKKSNIYKKIEFEIFNKVNAVCSYSQFEIDVIKKEIPNIKAIKVPLNIYKPREPICFSEEKKDLLFVGSFYHPPNADGILWFCNNIFPQIVKEVPEITLHILGNNPSDAIKNLASKNIQVKGYVSDEELKTYYKNCRLVIAPLRFGAGIKGKIIEAILNQVPVVTTSIGAEGLDNSAKLITIADNEINFAEKIISLYSNMELLRQISSASSQYIQEHFSKEAAIEALSKEFELTVKP